MLLVEDFSKGPSDHLFKQKAKKLKSRGALVVPTHLSKGKKSLQPLHELSIFYIKSRANLPSLNLMIRSSEICMKRNAGPVAVFKFVLSLLNSKKITRTVTSYPTELVDVVGPVRSCLGFWFLIHSQKSEKWLQLGSNVGKISLLASILREENPVNMDSWAASSL